MKLSAKTIATGIGIILMYIYAFPLALLVTFLYLRRSERWSWILDVLWLIMFITLYIIFPLLRK